jgi:hypothetical protein
MVACGRKKERLQLDYHETSRRRQETVGKLMVGSGCAIVEPSPRVPLSGTETLGQWGSSKVVSVA